MIVSINQPAYLPWLGYFGRIEASDVHVVLDHVQFEKNSFVNRNRVRTADGATWLTVPVRTAGRFGISIRELEIADERWRRKHWATIEQSYRSSPYFDALRPFLSQVYAREWPRLLELTGVLTTWQLEQLGITTRIVSSSELEPAGRKSALVLDLCRKLGATTYLSGPLGRNYLREELFTDAGIEIVYDDFAHPTYPQRFEPFIPAMAALDLLFNCGPASREVLVRGKGAIA